DEPADAAPPAAEEGPIPAVPVAPPRGELAGLPAADENLGTAPLPTKAAPVPEGVTAATAPTEEVPFDTNALHPLPDGAVLDGRYVLRGLIGHNPSLNLYRAVARNQQRCPACGAMAPPDDQTCARCGAALTGQDPQPSYLVSEALDPQMLLQDPAV